MDKKFKSKALHRAKIIEGQMKGLILAIDRDQYCVDVITQSLAIQNSLKSLDALVLQNHLQEHVGHQLSKPTSRSKAISELVKIYSLSKK